MCTFATPSFRMELFGQFPDLPQIHVDENGPLHEFSPSAISGDLDARWSPIIRKMPDRFISVAGTEVPLQHRTTQVMSNMERFLRDNEKSAVAPGLFSDYYGNGGLDREFKPLEFNAPYEAQDPYPWYYGQRYSSPEGSWSVDRSATEHESSSSGSAFSPGTSQGDFEFRQVRGYGQFDAGYTTGLGLQRHSLSQLDLGYSSGLSGHYSHERSISDPCVALRDVQQYPDVEQEEQRDDYDPMDMKTEFYVEPAEPVPYDVPHGTIRVGRHCEEGTGSSSHDEDSSPEPAMSDHQPTPTKRRRCQIITVSPTSATAKRTSNRSPTSTGKVSKRSKPVPVNSTTSNHCPAHPSRVFKSQSEYRKHIQTAHTRPFVCTFSIYGWWVT